MNKVYPEWVQQHKRKGTTIKKVGNNYYLYKHSSKRVPGKKYPVPVDTYIGRITQEGVVESEIKKVDTAKVHVVVKEYGFSYSVERLCTKEWKEILGNCWQDVLDTIILKESPESYISGIRDVPGQLDPHIQLAAQKSSLIRRIKNAYGVSWTELQTLSTIYLVSISGRKYISAVSESQQEILDRLGVTMEVH